jgi:hypothetical protein
MGGQACVLYGAAQFSRDVDLAILADTGNLDRLRSALAALQAREVAVPSLSLENLERGHAIHFRCGHPDAAGLRIDVMARMRGVADFGTLWERRTEIADVTGLTWHLLSLPDLVQAKKTQRDKDWPMIRALLEADYFANRHAQPSARIEFWLLEMRSPELLIELAEQHRPEAERLSHKRQLLAAALARDSVLLNQLLAQEEAGERERDTTYWRALKAELEQLRHKRLK